MDSVSQTTSAEAATIGSVPAGFVPVVGLVGGVGSGKTSVARAVGGLRLSVIDADQIGHWQLQDPVVAARLVQEFGDQILEEGVISRARLGALVFQDSPAGRQRLQRLNEIVRPGIQAEIHRRLNLIPQDADVVVLDAALLLEAGWADRCDALIWIQTPLQQRQQRVAATRGWSELQHAQREAAQWQVDRKRASCEFEVDNSGSLEAAAEQLLGYLRLILRRGPRSHRSGAPAISTML